MRRVLVSGLLIGSIVFGASASSAAEPVELAELVPENTLLFVARTAGKQTAKAQAATALGKIEAEPQVARFCEMTWKALTGLARKAAARDGGKVALDAGLRVFSSVWGGQTGLALIDAGTNDKGFFVQAALISRIDGDAKTFDADVRTLLKLAGVGEGEDVEVAGRTLWKVKSPAPGGVFVGVVDGVFVVAVSKEAAEAVVMRIGGKEAKSLATSERLVESRKRIGGDASTRVFTMHLNMVGIRALVESMPMLKFSPVGAVMEAIGANQLEAITWESHAKAQGYFDANYLLFEKSGATPPAWESRALPRAGLAMIPRDPWWATAVQIDFAATLDRILGVVKAADADTAKDVRRELKKFDKLLGMSLRDDFLSQLGPTVILFDARDNGGIFFTGITAVVECAEGEKLRQSLVSLVKVIAKETGGAKQTEVAQETYREHVIEFVNVSGFPMPFAPAWSLHGKWMIVGFYPQTVRTAIDRALDGKPERDSILANADVIAAQKQIGAVGSTLMYSDTRAAVDQLYPYLVIASSVGASLAEGEGVQIDPSVLPSQAVVTRHLFADVRTSRSDDRGVLSAAYGPLPVGVPAFGAGVGAGTTSTALMASILLPSLSRARELSKRTVCMADLRAIGLAMQIYAQDHEGKFPPDFKSLVDNQMAVPKQFWCPSAGVEPGDLNACYVYVAGQGSDSDRRNVLVYEKASNHDGEGSNVLFVDGHVEFIKSTDRVAELVEETKARMEQSAAGQEK